MKLRVRLSMYFLLVICVVAGSSLIFIQHTTENLFRSFIFSGDSEKAKIYATILADYYAENKGWQDLQFFLSEIPQIAFSGIDRRIHGGQSTLRISGYPEKTISALLSDRIAVADKNGVIVADTAAKILHTVHPASHLKYGIPIFANSEHVGTVLVGSMIDSSITGINERFLSSIVTSLIWGVLISAGLALFLGLIFSAQVTKPIVSLTGAVHHVAEGDLSIVVNAEGNDEIADLAKSFNRMIEELKRLENARKQIIADSAHELRTPVTLIQGTIEGMIDGVFPIDIPTLKSVHEETVRLSRLIDMLRELEIIESGKLVLSLETINVMDILHKAEALFASSAKEKDIALSVDPPDAPPLIKADYLRLSEVIYNLISNSIKYTPSGGRVRLRTKNDEKRAVTRIYVEDSGPGIPAEERERIFERFYRIDKSRSPDRGGRGLGLAIAREIVKAHGGNIAVTDSELGGAAFIIEMKAAS